MADATYYAQAPRRSPRRGGIRSVAEVVSGTNRMSLGGVLEYTSPGCGIAVGEVELCYPSPMADQAPKVRDGIETLEGTAPIFGVYAGVECWLGGSDFEADATRLLEQGADRAIEKELNDWVQTATPGTAQATLTDAIAAAENAADGAYPGLPVIVMNRADAEKAFAQRALEGDGTGNLWTGNGTPVLSSSQITAGKVAVTGAITLLEGDRGVFRTQNLTLNKEFAIAEQVFGLLVDCEYLAAFPVTP